MAAVPITIVGIATSDTGATSNVTLVGMASITGLGVGGGPMPGGPGGGGSPPGIWGGGNVPMPSPPIANVPGAPGYRPPGGGDAHPEHPIVLPPDQPPPTGEADEDGFIKPPPESGGWGYHEDYGWLYAPGSGSAGPK